MVSHVHMIESSRLVFFSHGPYGHWLAVYMCVSVLSGIIIGAVGPGGVMLAPTLLLLNVPIDVAGSAIVSSFAIGGVVTVVTHLKFFSYRRARLLGFYAVPGAIAGAALFPLLPAVWVSIFIACIAITCGVNILVKSYWSRYFERPDLRRLEVQIQASSANVPSPTLPTPTRPQISTSGTRDRSLSPSPTPTRLPISTSTSRDGLMFSLPPQTPSPTPTRRQQIPTSTSRDGLMALGSQTPSPIPTRPPRRGVQASPSRERMLTSTGPGGVAAAPSAIMGAVVSNVGAAVDNMTIGICLPLSMVEEGAPSATHRVHDSAEALPSFPPPTGALNGALPSQGSSVPHPSPFPDVNIGQELAARTGSALHDDDEYFDNFPRLRLRLGHLSCCLRLVTPPGTCALCGEDAAIDVPKSFYLAAMGFTIGFFSLLTSTGGPMIALPLFFRYYPRLSPVRALVLAQSMCIPNGVCAFLVAVTRREFDVGLSAAIGAAVSVGIPIGTNLAKRLPPRMLRILVGLMLVGVGGTSVGKVVTLAVQAR